MAKQQQQVQSSRPAWTGILQFSLVSIPVQALTVRRQAERIHLHWLHRSCGSRIKYQKVCPVHGEVADDEIVSAFEISKDHYVPLEKEELAQLKTQREDTIKVEEFVSEDVVDPLYFSDSQYYLVPETTAAQKPYATFHQTMLETGASGLAQIVLFKRQQLVVIRAADKLLTMTVLHHAAELRKIDKLFTSFRQHKPSPKEVELVRTLIESATVETFDITSYPDVYEDKLKKLINARKKGVVVSEPAEESPPPPTLNFADALRKSLEAAKRKRPHALVRKPSTLKRHRRVS